ncbi:MAG: DinB family protein [Candidatus Heimdallarchaeota archaeon]
MNKAELLASLKTERKQWDVFLAGMDEDRITQVLIEGEWSVKDIIVHVTWYEREIVELFRSRALNGSELWELPPDQRNSIIFEQNRHRALQEVLIESQQVFQELLLAVESLSEEDLVDPQKFSGMPTDWLPWKIIASNSFEHYQQHLSKIRSSSARSSEKKEF